MAQPTPIRAARGDAPAHLAREEAALFNEITRAYGLRDEVSRRILEEGLASLQRARKAREAVDKEGMTYLDTRNKPRPHPLLVVERDARAAALAAFRQLNLELPKSTNKRQLW
jgi:hypothetical protein